MLKKIKDLGEEAIKKEDLLGGEDSNVLQASIDALEFKLDVVNQCRDKVLERHPPLLILFDEYEQYVVRVLGKHGLEVL